MSEVKVYTTPTCPYCQMTKDYLKSQGVDYEELNVQQDLDARKEMVDESGQLGVPVTVSDGKNVVGYDVDKLNDLIKSAKQ